MLNLKSNIKTAQGIDRRQWIDAEFFLLADYLRGLLRETSGCKGLEMMKTGLLGAFA
jgi:hypothetical protein